MKMFTIITVLWLIASILFGGCSGGTIGGERLADDDGSQDSIVIPPSDIDPDTDTDSVGDGMDGDTTDSALTDGETTSDIDTEIDTGSGPADTDIDPPDIDVEIEEPCIKIDRTDNPLIIPPAGVHVAFRVLACDGSPVRQLTNTDMTVINDEKGEPFGAGMEGGGISDLVRPSNFGLFTALALDMSDSIFNSGSLNDVIDGALVFVDRLVTRPEPGLKHRVALIAFGRPDAVVKELDFTNDSVALIAKLEELRSSQSRGSTDLYGAYMLMLEEVENQGQGFELVERFAVILTDGTHEAGDEASLREQAMTAKANSRAAIYSLGIQGNYDERKLIELASIPGNYLRVEDASQLVSVFGALATRVAELARSNYVVGVCTPVSLGNPSLTIKLNLDGLKTEKTVPYSVEGLTGDVENCDPAVVAEPCKGRECGPSVAQVFECGICPNPGRVFCSETGQCIDDCAGRVCGSSPRAGYNCGTCSDHGTCNPFSGACTCENANMTPNCGACIAGYIGYPNCRDDPCTPDPCNAHGTCSTTDGTCTCTSPYMTPNCGACIDGYIGYPDCRDGDLCAPDPCNGHGTCSTTTGACTCDNLYMTANCGTCRTGYIGYPACRDNPCDPDPCSGHGSCDSIWGNCTCNNIFMTANCGACISGYFGYPNCEDDFCAPDPCNGHGICNATNGTCTCYNLHMTVDCGACTASYENYPSCDRCAARVHGLS